MRLRIETVDVNHIALAFFLLVGCIACDPSTQGQQGQVTVVALSAGTAHSLALGDDGSVWRWGRVSHDQLGVVSEASPGGLILRPERVAGLTAIVALAGGGILDPNGYGHSLALAADG
jgi:hypothetical protein